MTQKHGYLVMDLTGLTITPEEKEILAHPHIGGVILFSRNFESRSQLAALCRQIRASRKAPLLIMVDQEGGRVQRFKAEFSLLPSMGVFGKRYDDNPKQAILEAKASAALMAKELVSAGIDISLAPVLDLDKGVSTVIGDRAFHAKPEVVMVLAQAFIDGMLMAGMAATGKHFPGHGSVVLDSHVAMPVDERSFSAIEKEDLIPFKGLIQQGLRAVMAAHIRFPLVDALPVGYSPHWLQTVLRKQLSFNGMIFSDDLNMEGANLFSDYRGRVQTALDAGCDMALLCNNRPAVVEVLDGLSSSSYWVDEHKWNALKIN